jgi:hypothetical protein
MIYIVKDGKMHKYDGWFGEFAALVMQMQRVAEPTIYLDDEDDIM